MPSITVKARLSYRSLAFASARSWISRSILARSEIWAAFSLDLALKDTGQLGEAAQTGDEVLVHEQRIDEGVEVRAVETGEVMSIDRLGGHVFVTEFLQHLDCSQSVSRRDARISCVDDRFEDGAAIDGHSPTASAIVRMTSAISNASMEPTKKRPNAREPGIHRGSSTSSHSPG